MHHISFCLRSTRNEILLSYLVCNCPFLPLLGGRSHRHSLPVREPPLYFHAYLEPCLPFLPPGRCQFHHQVRPACQASFDFHAHLNPFLPFLPLVGMGNEALIFNFDSLFSVIVMVLSGAKDFSISLKPIKSDF